jgi:hypothetical protein
VSTPRPKDHEVSLAACAALGGICRAPLVTKGDGDRKQPLALVHLASRLLDRDGPLRCWGYNFLALVTISAAKRALHRPRGTSRVFEDALAEACKKAVKRVPNGDEPFAAVCVKALTTLGELGRVQSATDEADTRRLVGLLGWGVPADIWSLLGELWGFDVPCDDAFEQPPLVRHVAAGAAKESDMPNFKGSDLGRVPLVSADFWTSDRLSERSRRVDAFVGTRARGTPTLKRIRITLVLPRSPRRRSSRSRRATTTSGCGCRTSRPTAAATTCWRS